MFKKIEFSKLILITVFITGVAFSLIAAYLALKGADVSSYAPIVLAIWAQLGTSSGFYYWKAKAENKIKLLKQVPADLRDEANEILKDQDNV